MNPKDSEYALHCKLKNNLIYRRIMGAGYSSVNEFCRINGLQPSAIGELINLRKKPITKTGAWRSDTKRMADALGVEPEDLFTEQQKQTELPSNVAMVQLPESLLIAATNPDLLASNEEMKRQVVDALSHLGKRERRVLELKYFSDKTSVEIGRDMGVSGQRVRDIEMAAIRKLRHPRFGYLHDHISEHGDARSYDEPYDFEAEDRASELRRWNAEIQKKQKRGAA
jgi:RNA polymerase sigma factor (sigma-70 family)